MPFGPWKILRERDYALVWTTCALSDFGSWMQIGALGIYVTESTGAARWTGIASTITYLTAGLCAPFGGVLADRLDRKKLMVVAFLLQAFVGMVLTLCFANGARQPLLLIALAGVQGVLASAVMPALSAMVPDLVPKGKLANAAFLEQISWNICRAFGPPAAVALVALSSYTAVFVINALTYLAIAACLPFVRVTQQRHHEVGSVLQRLKIGWAGLRTNSVCYWATIVAGIEMILLAPFIAFIPVMGQITLHGTASTSALLFLMQGVGSTAGAILMGSVMHRYGQARSLVVLACTEPAFLLLYALSPNVFWAVVLITVLGAIHTAVYSLFSSIVQCSAEPAVRARVIAISRALVVPTYAISSTMLGVVVTGVGLRATFAVFGFGDSK